MRPSTVLGILLTLLLHGVGSTLSAAGGEKSTPGKSVKPKDKIRIFDLNRNQAVGRSASDDIPRPTGSRSTHTLRRSVGSALSPNAGIGKGESVDLTYDDAQYTTGQGRHISHWWNGEYGGSAEVSVHFGYRSMTDTLPGYPEPMSGYNVYNAIGGVWPRGQDVGCDLQMADTLGWGTISSLDVMPNGRAVMTSMSHYFNGFLAADSAFVDNMVFYQSSEFGCSYVPGVTTTSIDTSIYRPLFMDQSEGNYSRYPQVISQWDGVNTIVHVLLIEELGTPLAGSDYVDGLNYYTCTYFRKVGSTATSGSWSAGQIIDSLWFPWASMAAAFPIANVAVSYTNPSYYGALLNNGADLDVWYRESLDRGLTWQPAVDFTNYYNAIYDHPSHFTAWLESQCLYSTDGDLHIIWTARPTSLDPYFDGFNWWDFDANVYHWARSTAEIVKIANGNFNDFNDYFCGSFNTMHCGFGGSNAGYIANINIAQCDDKLYCVWNQIHERANYNDWLCYQPQPMPGVLDDCSYTGSRLAMANWDIFMSVSKLENSSLWDVPRNVSNTYTPGCGLLGDPEAEGPCVSEYKPMLEMRALDESGLELYWPAETIVDLSPGQDYTGGWYLNMQYVDDQFPGPAFWERTNPPGTLNSIKWVRLACVEPVVAPVIAAFPFSFAWPEWVELGHVNNLTVTVRNEGNVTLNITEIGFAESTGSGWLSASESPTPSFPLEVPAGEANTATFDIIVDASGIPATTWLDGEVWLKSDAINEDSTSIFIHMLAAADVEPVRWDTIQSHVNMFDVYFYPEGECVALAVSNMGEFGWGAGTSGSVNLDYVESELECGSRFADGIYLRSGSAFVITADDSDGSNAQLTCSYNDISQAQETGWDPTGDRGSIDGGLSAGGEYDSTYTGRFVNRDTSIAMERIFYAPRAYDPENETINYVICYTKFFSGDGQPHDHVTVGNVIDWDVPSERQGSNTSGISGDGFLYVQGTDTTGVLSCKTHTRQFATEAMGGSYTSSDWLSDNCVNGTDYFGANALSQSLLEDTTHYRDGTPLIPPQPNPEVWWQETSIPGLNPDANPSDQAVWFTYKHDFSLGAQDTLHFWTVLTTVRDGSLADLEAQVDFAKCWYWGTIRWCDCCMSCCEGRVGDANGLGGDEPTIGDVSVMIAATFIYSGCGISGESLFPCIQEADVNQSGGRYPECDDITIGDISTLIDYLFITGPDLGLNECLSGWKSGEKTSMPCK